MEQDQPRTRAAQESPAVGVLDQQRAETQHRRWLRSLLDRIGYCGLLRRGSGRAQCERRYGRKHQRRHRGGTRIGLRRLVGRAVFRATRIVLRMRRTMALGRHHLRAGAGLLYRALRFGQHADICGHRHLLEQQAKQRHPDPQDTTMAAAKRQAHGWVTLSHLGCSKSNKRLFALPFVIGNQKVTTGQCRRSIRRGIDQSLLGTLEGRNLRPILHAPRRSRDKAGRLGCKLQHCHLGGS